MKRPRPKSAPYHAATGDIKSDFSTKQLAAIGAVAMMYNEVELRLDGLVVFVVRMPDSMQHEICTRINGLEGKVEIIKAAIPLYTDNEDHIRAMRDSVGNGGFMRLKSYRDSVLHARAYNVPLGVGVRIDRQAKLHEVLVSQTALERLYDHLSLMRDELQSAMVAIGMTTKFAIRARRDQETVQFAKEAASYWALFLESRSRRLALPPLPEFPTESELLAARGEWIKSHPDAP